jgi:hypothetical protein
MYSWCTPWNYFGQAGQESNDNQPDTCNILENWTGLTSAMSVIIDCLELAPASAPTPAPIQAPAPAPLSTELPQPPPETEPESKPKSKPGPEPGPEPGPTENPVPTDRPQSATPETVPAGQDIQPAGRITHPEVQDLIPEEEELEWDDSWIRTKCE